MATIPTLLYYLALFFMVELDARKFGMSNTTFAKVDSVWNLTRKYWFHFLSLISIIIFMSYGYSPVLSVFWATIVTALTSFLHPDSALIPYAVLRGRAPPLRGLYQSGLVKALQDGSVGVVNVAATCAGAGIIVGVVTLTGLGLKFSSIVIEYAGGSLLLTAFFTSLVVWIVGLAVPVTASYIICAVITAPALIKLGVPDFAAHMFIFYYAVLSEVSPPTALSPFAAAAITGGDPYKTTMQCWKYTVPAFLLPFMFVLEPAGQGLLLNGSIKNLAHANWASIIWITIIAGVGIASIAAGFQGWALKRATVIERVLFIAAGFALVLPGALTDVIGFACIGVALVLQWLRRDPAAKMAPRSASPP
jgi:TRAP transporter 4TM/12TM fusion protein